MRLSLRWAPVWALLFCPTAAAAQESPAADWWNQLPAERRQEMWLRYERYRGLNLEAQQEIQHRAELLAAERRAALAEMTPEQRAAWDAMTAREQRQRLDEIVRSKLLQRAQEIERQYPAAFGRLRQMPLPERMQAASRMLEKSRGEEARAALQRAVEEGWLGQRALESLEQASFTERLSALGEVNKLRFLERARREGIWERYGINEIEQARLVRMSPIKFFRVIGMLERGVPKDRILGQSDLWDGLR